MSVSPAKNGFYLVEPSISIYGQTPYQDNRYLFYNNGDGYYFGYNRYGELLLEYFPHLDMWKINDYLKEPKTIHTIEDIEIAIVSFSRTDTKSYKLTYLCPPDDKTIINEVGLALL